MIKKYLFSLIVATIFLTSSSRAQESMMQDISYVFLEKLIATAKENYPRFKSLQRQTQIAKNNISREKASWLDAFSFSYLYNPDKTYNLNQSPTPTTNPFFSGYQVALSLNLSAIVAKSYNVRQAREEFSISELAQQEYNLTIETEVKRRYFAYLQQFNNLKLQTKMASDAQSMHKDVRSRYERSEITFEQYNGAQISLAGTMQSKIAAEANFLSAKASLEELVTKKLEEIQ